MAWKRAVGVGLLAVAAFALAQPIVLAPPKAAKPAARSAAPPAAKSAPAAPRPALEPRVADGVELLRTPLPEAGPGPGHTLKPRRMPRKPLTADLRVPDETTGRVTVKFRDVIQARITNDGAAVYSKTGYDLGGVNDLLAGSGYVWEPVISKSQQQLTAIEEKAASHSGYAQPDLGGIMWLTSAAGAVPLGVAAALNDLEVVEFAYVEPTLKPAQIGNGACCQVGGGCTIGPNTNCVSFFAGATSCGGNCTGCCDTSDVCADDVPPDVCTDGGGTSLGQSCAEIMNDCQAAEEPQCGDSGAGDCFSVNGNLYCDLETCCNNICSVDPFCCEEDTDWPQRGAPTWDAWCADHAFEICGGVPPAPPAPPFHDPADPTPDFSLDQGYLTSTNWALDPPPDIAPALHYDVNGNVIAGYDGTGYDLQNIWNAGEVLAAPPPQGSGLGPNRARGLGIRVGVVDYSAWVREATGPEAPYFHEDLDGKVITEPGVTPMINPFLPSFEGSHGTAVLGIIGAIDNDFTTGAVRGTDASPSDSIGDDVQRGIVGIATHADLYFFPAASVDQPAGRVVEAVMSAIDLFEPGDVLCFPFQPNAQCETVATVAAWWMALRMAADAGITCVISAGNDCCDLANGPQAGEDAGCIVVGAVYPGLISFNSYCRLPSSNNCGETCGPETAVHVSAWGDSVATLGAENVNPDPTPLMFQGDTGGAFSGSRTYVSRFGGTSAAAAQVAGVTACMQGLAKQVFGIPLTAVQMRDLVSGNGFFQCGFQDTDNLPGTAAVIPETAGCGPNVWIYSQGDWDIDANANRVGSINNVSFTEVTTALDVMLTQGWFDDCSEITDLSVLVGTLVFGNVNSLCTNDDNYLVIDSTLTTPSGRFQARNALGFGKVTDVEIFAEITESVVMSLSIEIEGHVTNGAAIAIAYIYDWNLEQWLAAGVTFFGPLDTVGFFPIPFGADRFVNASSQVRMRVWTLSMGVSSNYTAYLDHVGLNVSADPFLPP